jgi:AcrR family transcriptional regulator
MLPEHFPHSTVALPAPLGPRGQGLLDRVTDECLRGGISERSLRHLATAAASNNRMLLYYFGSKEQLLVAAVANAARRFPLLSDALAALRRPGAALESRLVAAWEGIIAEANEPFLRLFFEIVGLAGRDPDRFADFRANLVEDWPGRVAAALEAEGVSADQALELADQLVALWRGLQIELLAGADRDRINGACRDACRQLAQRVAQLAGQNFDSSRL